jgi:hypothetical protein
MEGCFSGWIPRYLWNKWRNRDQLGALSMYWRRKACRDSGLGLSESRIQVNFWKIHPFKKILFIYLFLFIYLHVHTLFGSFLHPSPLPSSVSGRSRSALITDFVEEWKIYPWYKSAEHMSLTLLIVSIIRKSYEFQ